MRSQQNSCWLQVRRRNHVHTVSSTPLLSDKLEGNRGYPSLFCCIGSKGKDAAFRWLATSKPAGRTFGDVHLHVDRQAGDVTTERPLLYADITVEEDSLDVPASNSIGDQLKHDVDTHCLAPVSAYAGVLGILTDVVCVFLPDSAALDMAARVVASWSPNQHEDSLPLPRLVVVVKTSPGQNQDKLRSQLLATIRRKTAAKMLEARFSAVGVYALPVGVDVSAQYQFGRLRDHMKSESDIVRRHRIANSLLFNSRHVATLAESAYTSYVNGQPFDIVRATRARNPVPRKMQHSMERFIRRFANEEAALATFVLPHVASAMMLDAFPPGMHSLSLPSPVVYARTRADLPEFAPEQVYRSLYKTVFVGALAALGMPKKYEAILRSIIARRPRRTWTEAGRVEGQHKFMRAYARRWRNIYSDRDCLVCLCRTPEYALACGHSVCAVDARRFGEKTGPDSFVINACPLCFRSVGTLQYRVKPKTKGINVLSVDGGGVRGIIPLQILQLLEKRLSSFLPNFPVQNHFDLVVGTSSGGLIALGAVMKDFSVSCCMNMLRNMSASVFRPRLPLPGWLQGRALRLLTIYLFGSLYPSESIDTFLRNALGDKKLLDHCAATARGAKVAVTASGVPRGGYLLSNYNGAGSDEHRGTSQHIRATGPPDRASVYDAARATTAAPGVFWPHSVPRVGKLQDGAICGENCPKRTALCESRSLWPGARRGVTLSLGTGYTDARPTSPVSPTTTQAPKRAGRLSGVFDTLCGYVSSLFHVVDSFMDGEAAYDRCTLEDGPALMDGKKDFRCNLRLEGPVPALDDLDAIEGLRSQTSAAFQDGEQIDAVTRALLSTLFYFELTARPMKNRSSTTCVGRIVCNLDPGTDLHHLIMSLAGGGAEFFVQGVVVPLQRKSVDYRNTRFQQSIQLNVRDLDAEFPIALRVSGLGCEWEPVSISSSPFTLRGLLDSQGWSNHFGNADDTPTSPTRPTRSRKRSLNV